ncbi:MAG: flagellar motor switch protein FliG [Deltaproteobacteria bacterium]|nr:flagellar motor switch protein FliG [Deltaproteobacteria bacterium]MBW2018952.1 flagellar motor switch protein FliG [Deltaproteobacteria bacterium]MBW2073167.1 flagellar motor switch protein FliG [Deltaproteobacteria bacterium]RLB83787.1 MAG: flagellar motor switch protein FliG [Deltaproteobacteria bacterium]
MAEGNLKRGKLTGPQKAAIFLLMMGEEYTAQVFQKLGPEEISKLVTHMSEIQYVPPYTLTQIMEEFVENIEGDGRLLVEGASFLKNVVEGALGKEQAKAIHRQLEKSGKDVPFGYFENMDKGMAVNIIKGEHPQTIALILAHLKPSIAAEILAGLPEQIQASVAMRIGQIEQVPREVVHEVDQALHKEVMGLGDSGGKEVEGVSALADILNEIERGTEEQILSWIEEQNADMAEQIRQLMFIFEDLTKVDDRGMREILKHVDRQQLAVALRTASEELKEKIFANLSERAGEMLREDMEVLGPLRISEVEEAQQKIIRIARQLEGEGKIILGKGKEDIFV